MSISLPVKSSPLCQAVSRAGKTVRIDIRQGREGGWLLQVIDERSNSMVWDNPFETDSGALDEALDTIEKYGIETLISPEPWRFTLMSYPEIGDNEATKV